MDFKLDQTVYFLDKADDEICVGVINGMFRDKSNNDVTLTLKNVKRIDTEANKYAEVTIKAECCHETVDALVNSLAIQLKAERDIYRWGINSVEDLIQFVLKHDVSGQSYNPEIDEPDKIHDIENKRAVFIEKVKELLGLKIQSAELPNLL